MVLLIQKNHFVSGAVNVVMGNASQIGDTLLASTQVMKITFTSSTAVGKKLMAGAATTVKKVSLELGGNAPCIIFDDADLDVALKGTCGVQRVHLLDGTIAGVCTMVARILGEYVIRPRFSQPLRKTSF